MSKNLYQAAILHARAKALESLAVIEILLNNPSSVPDHTDYMSEIMKHAESLARNEAIMITLNQYFGPKPEPLSAPSPPQPAPSASAPSSEPPIKVTEDMSPTYKKSVAAEKIRKSARKSAPNKKK